MELPKEFREYAVEALGEEIAGELFAQIEQSVEITSIRVNPHKGVTMEVIAEGLVAADGNGGEGRLGGDGCDGGEAGDGCDGGEGRDGVLSPVLWSSCGHDLPRRPLFTLDPLFHAGA